jgi:hypothetical protein
MIDGEKSRGEDPSVPIFVVETNKKMANQKREVLELIDE